VTEVSSQPDLWHKDRTDCDVIVSEDLPGIGRGSGRGNSNAIAQPQQAIGVIVPFIENK
jgi:hypothetical protein